MFFPLANPKQTFRTFELIADKAPDIKLCLSTNGLMLPDHVQQIKDLNFVSIVSIITKPLLVKLTLLPIVVAFPA